jgi:hypothetical protein
MRIRNHAKVALVILLPFISIGCEDDATPPQDGQGYPEATSIDQLLENYQRAHQEGNVEEYEKLLDESFEFVFDSSTVGVNTCHWDRWSKEEEIAATRNLFSMEPDSENRVLERIRMTHEVGIIEDSDQGDVWKRIHLKNFEIELEMTDQDDGQTWFLRNQNGYRLTLLVRPGVDDPSVWRIVQIEDLPPRNVPVGLVPETGSWGGIKASYRDPDHPCSYPPPRSIKQLMRELERSFRDRETDEFTKLFDESFEFVFDPQGIGEDDGWKDPWPSAKFLQSMRNFFEHRPDSENRIADQITLDFEMEEIETSPVHPDWKRVILSDFHLEVVAIDADDGQAYILRTPTGHEIVTHLLRTAEPAPVWKFVRLEEDPLRRLLGEDDPPVLTVTWEDLLTLWE